MQNTEKKKRGRKPKQVVNTEPPSSTEKIPKKRGRKPKGGKIIQQPNIKLTVNQSKPNVILHLKCSSKELERTNYFSNFNYNPNVESIEAFNLGNNNKLSEISYEIINTGNINHLKEYNNTRPECDTQQRDNMKDIWSKLKLLENNLHRNNISDKKSACFWCTFDFDNPPVYIPKFQTQNSYDVYGCFCSPECAVSFLMDEHIDSSTKFERYHILNHIYGKIYNYTKNIKPAPNPYYILDKYYGNLSISEYRNLLQNEQLLFVVDKPLTRILPELHEDNHELILNHSPTKPDTYKLRRKGIRTHKVNIMSENFGFNK